MISVLYVDDEPALLDIGKFFLEKRGDIQVDLANSAKSGLNLLKAKKYDAIVSDYQMPEMSGLEFLKEIRHQYGQIPFILFTGKGREEVVILALNCGVDFYVQKGGEPKSVFADLRNKIEKSVREHQAVIAEKASEQRLIEIIDFLPIAIIGLSDNNQKTDYINPAFITLSGYTLDEIPSINEWWVKMYPDEQSRDHASEEWNRRVKYAIKTRATPEPMETTITCKDGSKKVIICNYIHLGEKGYVYGMDVTGYKRAEESSDDEDLN